MASWFDSDIGQNTVNLSRRERSITQYWGRRDSLAPKVKPDRVGEAVKQAMVSSTPPLPPTPRLEQSSVLGVEMIGLGFTGFVTDLR